MNLEIGCGHRDPGPGWESLDIRPLKHVTYVQSAVDLSNIESGRYERVIADDIIEHISWRDVPKALKEWLRVTAPGGMLEIETPNAMELVEQVVNPDREGLPRWRGESDWQRFSRTAFGHQDYPENAHLCYFTPDWLRGLLLDAGASWAGTMHMSLLRFRLAAMP